jgi:hypothetical protein
MRLWVPFVAALVVNPSASPSWRVGPAPSDFPELQAATVINEAGDQLYLWPNHRDDRFQIFAELHLAPPRAFDEAMPSYSIDGGPAVDVEQIRKEGEANFTLTADTRGSVSFWRVWSSADDTIRKDEPLHDWLTGKVLVVRFKTDAGTEEDARFPLGGAAEAIATAAGVTAE